MKKKSELKKPLHRDIEGYNFREIFLLEIKLGLGPETLDSNSTLCCFSINESSQEMGKHCCFLTCPIK